VTNYFVPDLESVDEDYFDTITSDLQLALSNLKENEDPAYRQEFYDEVQELLKLIGKVADALMPEDG
jgi:hypothetical protein